MAGGNLSVTTSKLTFFLRSCWGLQPPSLGVFILPYKQMCCSLLLQNKLPSLNSSVIPCVLIPLQDRLSAMLLYCGSAADVNIFAQHAFKKKSKAGCYVGPSEEGGSSTLLWHNGGKTLWTQHNFLHMLLTAAKILSIISSSWKMWYLELTLKSVACWHN